MLPGLDSQFDLRMFLQLCWSKPHSFPAVLIVSPDSKSVRSFHTVIKCKILKTGHRITVRVPVRDHRWVVRLTSRRLLGKTMSRTSRRNLREGESESVCMCVVSKEISCGWDERNSLILCVKNGSVSS